jgi:hypothetical protein
MVLSRKIDGSLAKVPSMITGLMAPTMLRRCAYEPGQCTSDMSRLPPAVTVGNERGDIDAKLDETNRHPWCVVNTPFWASADVEAFKRSNCMGGPNCINRHCIGDPKGCELPPSCPVEPTSRDIAAWDDPKGSAVDEWARRGAINAGFAVFLYLKDVAENRGGLAKPTYDHCEALQP